MVTINSLSVPETTILAAVGNPLVLPELDVTADENAAETAVFFVILPVECTVTPLGTVLVKPVVLVKYKRLFTVVCPSSFTIPPNIKAEIAMNI